MKVNEEIKFCEACKFGKSHAIPFTLSLSHARSPFELVHSDLWGPAPVMSIGGYRYYVHFLDNFSRLVWIYPLKLKSDAIIAFSHFIIMVRNQFKTLIKALQQGGIC